MLVDTSIKYCVADGTEPQFALKEVQLKLSAGVAVGDIGAVVPKVTVFE
ncbi:hypothetical protein [Bacillus cereus group sp. Bc237]